MSTVTANGTELCCEVRGSGPTLLCIMGASGDGAHFNRLAALLADQFTVVTYDRRGNGRSPRPTGWVLMRAGIEAGGPHEALKRFFVLVGGETNWATLDTDLRERMLRSADTFLRVELGTFESYLPTNDELAAVAARMQLLVSEPSAE